MLGVGFEVVAGALVLMAVFNFQPLRPTLLELKEICRRDDASSSDDDDNGSSNFKYVSLSGLIRRAKRREKRWGRLRRLPSVLNPNPHRSIFYSTSRRRLERASGDGGSGRLVRTVSGRGSIWHNG